MAEARSHFGSPDPDAAPRDAPVVIKFGGSLLGSTKFDVWRRAIEANVSKRRLVIVPGGGVFADAVREAQRRHGFDDAGAHDMALLAMAQLGHLLCHLSASAKGAMKTAALEDIEQTATRGCAAVWTPDPVSLARFEAIVPGWDITSDSLAAWLAHRLRARALVLLKSASIDDRHPALTALAGTDLVDEAFARFMPASGLDLHILGPEDASRLDTIIDNTQDQHHD